MKGDFFGQVGNLSYIYEYGAGEEPRALYMSCPLLLSHNQSNRKLSEDL